MPLEQHPVPQHISSYEFHLVGEMTLRQFGYLAAGAIFGLIFYSLPIAPFFKWFFICICVFSGFAFAFLPVEGRPLIIWVTSFLKAIFSPTLFIWQKREEQPAIFASVPIPPQQNHQPPISTNKKNLTEYLQNLSTKSPFFQFDQKEKSFLKNIGQLFQAAPASPAAINQTPSPKPVTSKPTPIFVPKTAPKPFIAPIKPTPEPAPVTRPAQVKPASPVVARPPLKPKRIEMPFIPPVVQTKRIHRPIVTAQTAANLPFPEPPKQPNILTGMVLDKDGQIIAGAILEIRDQNNLPVRALKTNQLGQFTIATPLANGTYEIETEKEGYKFDIIKIEAKGEVIKPIKIQAK